MRTKETNFEPQTIGDHIRKHRLLLKLTQKAVAGILKVSQFSIINWERGEFQPSKVATLHRIIAFLGYDPLPAGQTIPERLRQQRRLMGWGQRELARHLGVDRCTVTGWELDRTILKCSHRSMVAQFLGLVEADLTCEMGTRWNKNHGKRSAVSTLKTSSESVSWDANLTQNIPESSSWKRFARRLSMRSRRRR